MNPSLTARMPFYCLGQIDTSSFNARPFSRNNAIADCSADLLLRNKLTNNSATYDRILKKDNSEYNDMKSKKVNNYLDPVHAFNTTEK
jgi:hypothetical protein